MKKAILVVSFGTAYKSTREETIEACENKIKEEFSEYDFYRAYTSNKIIQKNLAISIAYSLFLCYTLFALKGA